MKTTTNKINYIGSFPPPYGGVTIRNSEFLKALNRKYKIEIFNTSELNNVFKYIKLLFFLLKNRKNNGIISTSTPSFIKLTKILNRFFSYLMPKYIIITAGGSVDKHLLNSNISNNVFNKYRKYFVETNILITNITELGINNVNFLPNCRLKPKNRFFKERESNNLMKFISISRISHEKGIDTILKADKLLKENNNYHIDFYGPIDKEIKSEFLNYIDNKNVFYKGIFEGDKFDINDLLVDYDVLLFPTRHLSEGHAGVLTNAKIAGCAIIATDINANTDIVKDNINGLIIKESTAELLAESMLKLLDNLNFLDKIKIESYESAKVYFVENHIDKLIDALN
jgi:glycosyltransferase involved in cell wall biosynthesis